MRTDNTANVNTLVTQINNGHGDQEPYITTYQSTTSTALWGPTCSCSRFTPRIAHLI